MLCRCQTRHIGQVSSHLCSTIKPFLQFHLVTLLLSLAVATGLSAQTPTIWITTVQGLTSPIEGARVNVNDQYLFLDGFYDNNQGVTDQIRVHVNGALADCPPGEGCQWSDSDGSYSASFSLISACQKMSVQVERYFHQGTVAMHWYSEPIGVFVISASNGSCVPECDDCNKSSSGQGAGAPVDIVNGKMYYSTMDLAMSGPNGIRFERYYDNQTSFNLDLGYGWRHSYSHYLDVTGHSNQAWYYDNHGHLAIYGKDHAGAYVKDWTSQTSLTYDSATQTYQLLTLQKTIYKFNSSGKLTAIVDRKGNTQTIAYDTNNPPRISSVTDAFGKQITFGYSGTDVKIRTLTTTPDSRVFSYGYDANNGNLLTFTDPLTKIWRYEYTDTDIHNLTGIKDPLNHYLETHTYYANDTTQTSTKDGNQESLAFTYSSGTTTALDSLNRMTTYTYDPSLKIITSITGPGCGCGGNQTRTYTWDNFLRKLTETDARLDETKFEWFDRTINGQTYPTRNLHFLREAYGTGIQRNTEFRDYYAYGDPRDDLYRTEIAASVDTPGQSRIITYSYDTIGNLTSRQTSGYSNGALRIFTENMDYSCTSHGLLCSFEDPRTNVTHYAYFPDSDSDLKRRGQLQSVTDAAGNVTTYASAAAPHNSYDVYGNPKSIIDPNGVVTWFTYDNWGRGLNTTVKADGTYNYDILTQKRYQDDGLLDYIIQPEGNVTDFSYDSQHRQTEIQQKPNLAGSGDRITYRTTLRETGSTRIIATRAAQSKSLPTWCTTATTGSG